VSARFDSETVEPEPAQAIDSAHNRILDAGLAAHLETFAYFGDE
tara:strand:- start:1047 stop:1178 length:132 start_codon:yes stop_codon:yes gene_type:complete